MGPTLLPRAYRQPGCGSTAWGATAAGSSAEAAAAAGPVAEATRAASVVVGPFFFLGAIARCSLFELHTTCDPCHPCDQLVDVVDGSHFPRPRAGNRSLCALGLDYYFATSLTLLR